MCFSISARTKNNIYQENNFLNPLGLFGGSTLTNERTVYGSSRRPSIPLCFQMINVWCFVLFFAFGMADIIEIDSNW